MIFKNNLTTFLIKANLPHPNTVLMNLGGRQSKPKDFRFDMQVRHAIFNKTIIEKAMQHDTVYVSTLRHPFRHLVSRFFFHYKKLELSFLKTEFDRMLRTSFFQQNKNISIFEDRQYEFLENPMFKYFQFNYERAQLNATYFSECITDISTLFQVIITDKYDESLLLLRHKFCWDIKEIIYITHKNASFSDKNKEPSEYGTLYEKHQNISNLDYQLYSYFLEIHQKNVKAAGTKFQEELQEYKRVKADTGTFCWKIYRQLTLNKNLTLIDIASVLANVLVFERGKFWNEFTVTARDCVLMAMCEAKLRHARLALNYPITCDNNIPGFKYNHMFCANEKVNDTKIFSHNNLQFPYTALRELLFCDLVIYYV